MSNTRDGGAQTLSSADPRSATIPSAAPQAATPESATISGSSRPKPLFGAAVFAALATVVIMGLFVAPTDGGANAIEHGTGQGDAYRLLFMHVPAAWLAYLAFGITAIASALYVVPRYPVSYFEGGVTISAADVGKIEKQWNDDAQAVVDAVKDTAVAKGVKARAVLARSNMIAEAVMAAARKHKCDLIVMASHGRKGLSRVLLGSETQHVLTHSTVPVLVLR